MDSIDFFNEVFNFLAITMAFPLAFVAFCVRVGQRGILSRRIWTLKKTLILFAIEIIAFISLFVSSPIKLYDTPIWPQYTFGLVDIYYFYVIGLLTFKPYITSKGEGFAPYFLGGSRWF